MNVHEQQTKTNLVHHISDLILIYAALCGVKTLLRASPFRSQEQEKCLDNFSCHSMALFIEHDQMINDQWQLQIITSSDLVSPNGWVGYSWVLQNNLGKCFVLPICLTRTVGYQIPSDSWDGFSPYQHLMMEDVVLLNSSRIWSSPRLASHPFKVPIVNRESYTPED